MSTERSDQAYQSYIEALQKFDYFIVGVSIALVGYLGAALRPIGLGWNPATIELAAIASMLLSAVAGLKRIEANVSLLGASQKRLYEQEAAGALKSAALQGGPALNKGTGEFLSPGDLLAKAQYHEVGAEVVAKHVGRLERWSGRWYRARDLFLVLGLALLVLARLLAAYAS